MRVIRIPQKLVDFLRNEKRDNLLVCHDTKGNMFTETAWKRMWESYIGELNRIYGDFSGYIFSASMAVFAFSTVICWSYYGKCFIEYFTKNKSAAKIYLALYCACAAAGSVMQQGLIWELADFAVAVMTSLNLAAVLMLSSDVKKETEVFLNGRKYKKNVSLSPAMGREGCTFL